MLNLNKGALIGFRFVLTSNSNSMHLDKCICAKIFWRFFSIRFPGILPRKTDTFILVSKEGKEISFPLTRFF